MRLIPVVISWLLLLLFQVLASPATVTYTLTSSPPSASAAPQFIDDKLFVSTILNSTNFFRSEHNATAMVYNQTLAGFASSYLSSPGESNCAVQHSGGPYGENIAAGCSDAAGCVDAWGNERAKYNYDNPGFGEDTGHFTQLVWKNSTSVGCSRKWCGDSKRWFLLCEYWPRGNVIGQFQDEVGKQVNGTGSSGSSAALLTRDMSLVKVLGWVVMISLGVWWL
jgi:hypothetical protein